jgi:hypothetical protein
MRPEYRLYHSCTDSGGYLLAAMANRVVLQLDHAAESRLSMAHRPMPPKFGYGLPSAPTCHHHPEKAAQPFHEPSQAIADPVGQYLLKKAHPATGSRCFKA